MFERSLIALPQVPGQRPMQATGTSFFFAEADVGLPNSSIDTQPPVR